MRTGAQVVVINAARDGRNINAGCGATDPAGLRAVVTAEPAHERIALDGDADRRIADDERGDVVDGDHVIAICAADIRDRGLLRHDTVVVTVMTNLGFRIAMRDAGINVVETGVGDRYVLEALAAGGYSLGGEQSGHVIFTDHATTGDGMLTALVLLDVVQRSSRQLSQLAAAAMTQLPQVLVNIRVGQRRTDVGPICWRPRSPTPLPRSATVVACSCVQWHRAADPCDGRSRDSSPGARHRRQPGRRRATHPALV